ncbi:hypothetical protein [Novosphingobium sp.]|uniref:hypothetical protein n=1 Tax=Novosphingobium sp. TaxID=1874826 RepID=UPI003B5197D0
MASAQQDDRQFLYSPAMQTVSSATIGVGTNLDWDAYQRAIYQTSNSVFTKQAKQLLQRGNISEPEARALIDQRNALVRDARKPLSPMGKLYSEIKKPIDELPDYEALIARKGSNEAILRSVGKTNEIVDRLTVNMRMAGRGMIVLSLVLTVVVIVEAPPEQRARVASREGGALAGGSVGGWGGAWAGCATAAVIASPSLVLPIAGEVTEAGACFVGGIGGGLGLGAIGAWAGSQGGEALYDYVTTIRWRRP